ncbi:MAG TPA: STAS domain-containing protein [Fervidobacterium sp.]|nr:anti-sigma factor antagonist [Fervidobacterium sp.]HOK87401.1 STAS domain-containing protein [Fervidobacterium sp.]HOM73565.1 STAS domain-containing protein [Fervidobacterium sp.]HOQ39080.1 STAS domain-containing protein [Fervidobacterium sp.]HPP17480.1 STAS domain-containing protein [Fervidobacterium sp.]
MPVNFEKNEQGEKLIITIHGEIDAYHSGEVKKFLKDAINETKLSKIVLDMSEVNYIDSAGLGSLVALYKDARMAEKELVLACLKQTVMRIFEMTRLDRVFKIVQTVEEA